ncbi:MAG: nucleoside hydrolase [Candidatus Obscuribacter sp.]|jgi:purine nucleosidase|nr:nucleoside hydrolase [Candidatus Obscuribacter sp.]MBK9619323.1 nucleoside hydrolase [Candidatus Obscuribacter sp.]MBP6349322.1 nucleoside hydrolase [Candidatus Obscuribacter sp.]MBP6592050.1 nucleoside hydrolase [Candidatus Obscuribacter sp.]MBP7578011.1 nucleoside hydrolase [Candidatus Obscuribacter sp.]
MPKTVIHDHDGHVDDLLSCILLWLSPEIDLQAVGITNGDCYAPQIFEATQKIATLLDIDGPEIALTEDEIPNPFPDNWRRESYIINELPLFRDNYLKKTYQQGKPRRIDSVFLDCLSNSRSPLTVVSTGPLTNMAKLLEKHPELKEKISEFIIMGGAISVKGNVEETGHDGSAEWNVYADPLAFKQIVDSKVPIKLITLDLTNEMPVTKDFLGKLEAQSEHSKASALAATLWSLVKGFDYYFWDTITAAVAIEPSLFTFKDIKIDVSTSGKTMGRTNQALFGRKVQVATQVNKQGFEDLLLSTLSIR